MGVRQSALRLARRVRPLPSRREHRSGTAHRGRRPDVRCGTSARANRVGSAEHASRRSAGRPRAGSAAVLVARSRHLGRMPRTVAPRAASDAPRDTHGQLPARSVPDPCARLPSRSRAGRARPVDAGHEGAPHDRADLTGTRSPLGSRRQPAVGDRPGRRRHADGRLPRLDAQSERDRDRSRDRLLRLPASPHSRRPQAAALARGGSERSDRGSLPRPGPAVDRARPAARDAARRLPAGAEPRP